MGTMNKIEFYGTFAEQPKMSLKAKLAWEYYFGTGKGTEKQSWACIHPQDGTWIVCDEECDLDYAIIFPDDDSFINWLEETTKERLEDDAAEFLSQFIIVPELVNEKTIRAMLETIEQE